MTDAAAKIAARLAQLWQTSRATVLERVAILHSAQASLSANSEDSDARSAGREAAHKLAGILGVFGMPQGSEIAAEIEHLLKSEEPLSPADLSTLGTRIAGLDAAIAAKDNS